MITGDMKRKIRAYLPIDHCGEGAGYVSPKAGQEFFGVPYQYQSDNSTPFIEIREGGRVIATVNCADVSVVEFAG